MDNWAMDLAREVQIGLPDSTQSSPEWIQQECYHANQDDGYVSCSNNSLDACGPDEEEKKKDARSKDKLLKPQQDVKRLHKNEKQRKREYEKKILLDELKAIVTSSGFANPKGSRMFTELDTLAHTRHLIEDMKHKNR